MLKRNSKYTSIYKNYNDIIEKSILNDKPIVLRQNKITARLQGLTITHHKLRKRREECVRHDALKFGPPKLREVGRIALNN